ncbi:MAG: cupredoxin domain-containing protein [Candidatus Yonathbacteria bacterium]|nr:cupredoxin domain-containing protein [Candidatus Yonathbacteria bacterium]
MNKYILGGIGIIIIVATIILIKTDKPLSTKITPVANTGSIVVYTNDGFTPAELTVKTGTEVTFINHSDAKMWIASASHPTHLLYPEFDEKASVEKGGSYKFTFTKVGAHPYHNHVLLGKYGKVIVE